MDPGVASSIPARSHSFVEIDHEIISTVILLPSAESFMKGCCQLQGVASSIPARSHTFVEIDHEIIFTVILLPSNESFMKEIVKSKVYALSKLNDCLFHISYMICLFVWCLTTYQPLWVISVRRY